MRKLARALFRRAQATVGALPADGQARALAAFDDFLEDPGPSRFLATVRILASEERVAARQRLARDTAGRAFEDGIAALGASGLDPDTVRALADRPAAPGVGARLEALAALIATHRELAGRAEAAVKALRAQLHGKHARTRPG